MPSALVSPGILWNVEDNSTYIQNLSQTTVAVVGTAPRGPVNTRTFFSSWAQFTSIHGTPTPDHVSMFAVKEIFRYGQSVWFVRVNGDADTQQASVQILGQSLAASLLAPTKGPYSFVTGSAATVIGTDMGATVATISSSNNQLLLAFNGGPAVLVTLTPGSTVSKTTIANEILAAVTAAGGDSSVVGTNQVQLTLATGTGISTSVQILPVSNSAYTALGFVVGTTYGTNDSHQIEVTSQIFGTAAVVLGTDTGATVATISSGNQNLLISISGATAIPIALSTGSAVTKATIAGEIQTALGSQATCVVAGTNQIQITAAGIGTATSVAIEATTNSAYSALGFVVGTTYGSGTEVDTPITVSMTTGSPQTTAQVVSTLNTAFSGASFPAIAANFNNAVKITSTLIGEQYGIMVSTPGLSATTTGVIPVLGFTEGQASFGYGLSPATATLEVDASSPGSWGNSTVVQVSAGSLAGTFKMVFQNGVALPEVFDNLVQTPDQEVRQNGIFYFPTAINGSSKLVTVTDILPNTGPPAFGTYVMAGGDDGLEALSEADFIGVTDGTVSTGLQLFANPEQIDINVLMVPGVPSAAVNDEILAICDARQDCLGLPDPPMGQLPQQVVDWHNGEGTYTDHAALDSSQSSLLWAWTQVEDPYSGLFVWVPPSAFRAAALAYTDYVRAPWFASAGYQRGQIVSGLKTEWSDIGLPQRGDRDLLGGNGNAVNSIVKFPDGMFIWEDLTLQRAPTALRNLSVSRLLMYMYKTIATSLRRYLFDPNDPVLWRKIIASIDPFIQGIVAGRGISAYQII